MHTRQHSISVIIPVYNGKETLARCLDSVLNQTLAPTEIIIVDNNSIDSTKEIIRSFQERHSSISYIFEQRQGRAFARNTGINAATGTIIAMIDADCIASTDWLYAITLPIIRDNESIVMGAEESAASTFWSRRIQDGNTQFNAAHRSGDYITVLDTKNMAATTSLLQEYLFDELLGNIEDFELALRLRDHVPIRYAAEARVKHFHKTTMLSWMRLSFDRGFWVRRIYFLYRDDPRFKDESMFQNFRQGSCIYYLYLLAIEFTKRPLGDAFFIGISGIAWRAGALYESIRRSGIALFMSRKYYSRSLETLIQAFPATFASPATPRVSIIIPLFNQVRYTIQCLESIKENTTVSYEIILVDNGSTDQTAYLTNRLKNVTVLTNEKNLGYAHANNQGAQRARGNYLLFLNNDTVVRKRWLDHLLTSIESNETAGAVGPKLIFFNGRLQAAGCGLNYDGRFYGRGEGDLPNRHPYNQRIETVALYGTCLLVKKMLFEEVDGFDESYSPAYHEDIDLCLKIKEKGYSLYYEPRSIVHHKGFTSSRRQDREALLASNYQVLYTKWRHFINDPHNQTYYNEHKAYS